MKCTLGSFIAMIFLCLIAGSSYSLISNSLKYFTPFLIIFIRMISGFLICIILLIIFKLFFNNNKNNLIFFPNIKIIFHMLISGGLYQGICHILIVISQKWISSSMIQIMYPLIPIFSTIGSKILYPNEKINKEMIYSLIFSFIGVILTTLPTFQNISNNFTIYDLLIGYFLILISVIIWGFMTVYMKYYLLNYNILLISTYQLFSSTILSLLILLFTDNLNNIKKQFLNSTFLSLISPIIVGIFSSGLLMILMNYVIKEIGPIASNFGIFGQILVGLIIGILFLNEWNKYNLKDILLSIFGIIFLIFGIFIGFSLNKEEIQDEPLLLNNN